MPVFKTGAFNRSATPPSLQRSTEINHSRIHFKALNVGFLRASGTYFRQLAHQFNDSFVRLVERRQVDSTI